MREHGDTNTDGHRALGKRFAAERRRARVHRFLDRVCDQTCGIGGRTRQRDDEFVPAEPAPERSVRKAPCDDGTDQLHEILRGGKSQTRTIALRGFPRETLPGHTFEYGAVTTPDGSRLRTILSAPATAGRHPAVMLLQGGGCGSVDIPVAPDVGQTGLLRTIAAHGLVTMRVEKPGVGDSRGPACETIGYTQELDGYRAALAALKKHPALDSDEIFLLGISLGGVFAPVVANESPVRGIVVYGTLGSPPSPYPGRSDRFFREFAPVNVKGAWSNVSARVLILHGQFDETEAVIDHTQIAPWVNARHPGAARHRVLDGLDHCWSRHASMESSRGRCGQGQQVPVLADAILDFLRS